MAKQSNLQYIYGADFDLVDPRQHKRFSTLADEIASNLWRVGLCGKFHDLALTMLRHRYSLARVIPGISQLAREMGRSRQHVSGMVAVMVEHGLLGVERPAGPHGPCHFDLSPLIAKIRALLKRKKDAPPADRLPSRLPPKEKPAPVVGPEEPPDEEEEEEEEIAAAVPETEAARLWRTIKAHLHERLSAIEFDWIQPLEGHEYTGGILWVNTRDSARQMQVQNRFDDLIQAVFQQIEPGGEVRYYYPKPRRAGLLTTLAASLPGVG